MTRISGPVAIAVLGLFIPLSSAFAQTDNQTTQPDPNQIVCRAGEPMTGTRLPGARVCHTQKEWDQIRQDAQDALSGVQQKAAQAGVPGG